MEVSSDYGFRQFHWERVADGPHASCRYLGWTKNGEGRGCMSRNEAEEDRETTGEMIGLETQLHCKLFQ